MLLKSNSLESRLWGFYKQAEAQRQSLIPMFAKTLSVSYLPGWSGYFCFVYASNEA